MLDETRTIRSDLLQRLAESGSDMAFIGERETGNPPWARWAEIDRRSMRRLTLSELNPTQQLYALPRYYETGLLKHAFGRILEVLGSAELFSAICLGELEAVFIEAWPSSSRPLVLPEPMISHVADEQLTGFVRKYFNYGRSAKLLGGTPYQAVISPRSHRRGTEQAFGANWMRVQLMLLLRGVPFAIGFYL